MQLPIHCIGPKEPLGTKSPMISFLEDDIFKNLYKRPFIIFNFGVLFSDWSILCIRILKSLFWGHICLKQGHVLNM